MKKLTDNLKVTHYRNGDEIPQVSDPGEWATLTTGAWCHYDNDPANEEKYGKLYNWYAVNDPRGLAAEGYHIPTYEEFDDLELDKVFGGNRDYLGEYSLIGYFGDWWSSSQYDFNYAWGRYLYSFNGNAFRDYFFKQIGFSVRCLRDLDI